MPKKSKPRYTFLDVRQKDYQNACAAAVNASLENDGEAATIVEHNSDGTTNYISITAAVEEG